MNGPCTLLSIVMIIVVYVYFFKRFRVLTRQLSLCLELSEGQRDHSTCFDLSAVSISNVMLTVLLIAGTFGSTSGFWLALQFINFGTESKLADCSFTLCRAFGPGASQIIQSRKKKLTGYSTCNGTASSPCQHSCNIILVRPCLVANFF